MRNKSIGKKLEFSPTPSISEVNYSESSWILAEKQDVNGFSEIKDRKMLVKHPGLKGIPLGILQKECLH